MIAICDSCKHPNEHKTGSLFEWENEIYIIAPCFNCKQTTIQEKNDNTQTIAKA